MHTRHKPLREQVIVITGASSGIGLATARAPAGAVPASSWRRGTPTPSRTSPHDIRRAAARPLPVLTDVTEREDVERAGR